MTGYEYVEILLVEDNPTDAELAIRALRKKNLANNLVWVRDGAEALDFLFCKGQYQDRTIGSPKLILLDLKLPKVDGIEVLRTLKADEATRFVPVVMLTSSQEERDIVESYALGVNSYIVKPVDFAKFLDMVSQVGLYWSLVNKVPSR
ncbi:MAG TPA: response regulator [Hyphomicrobiaceae bacterium]|jgi:CheY-like chemotaxis protein|nr:response regulator [Hyphomicrobiaceae bacterium]